MTLKPGAESTGWHGTLHEGESLVWRCFGHDHDTKEEARQCAKKKIQWLKDRQRSKSGK